MQYALLIYADAEAVAAFEDAAPERQAESYARHEAFAAMLHERDAVRGGAQLAPSTTATTVRSGAGGEHLVTDGPFAEVAEHLVGFYLVEARDLDDVLELARALPSPTVEVRPMVVPEAGG